MAAIRTWIGTDPGNEGDYSVAANFSGAATPVATDTVICNGTSLQDITAGLTDGAGKALAAFHVTKDYTGSIGVSGSPLVVSATDMRLESGGAELWIEPENATYLYANPQTSGSNALQIGGASSSLNFLHIAGGRVTIVTGTTMGTFTVLNPAFGGLNAGPQLIVPAGVDWTSASSHVWIMGGELQLGTPISGANSVIELAGGKVLHIAGAQTRVSQTGGEYRHTAGTISAYMINAGLLDETTSTIARTITQLDAVSTNSEIDFRGSAASVTLTGFRVYGSPVVHYDETSTVTVN